MAIKHEDVKTTGQRGYASEWNKDHVIDDGTITTAKIDINADLPMNSKKITSLADPLNDQDAVTKKYFSDNQKKAHDSGYCYREETVTINSDTWIDVTDMSLSITTDGSKVFLSLNGVAKWTSDTSFLVIRIVRDANVAWSMIIVLENLTGKTNQTEGFGITWIDAPATGSHTYKVQAFKIVNQSDLRMMTMGAIELKNAD